MRLLSLVVAYIWEEELGLAGVATWGKRLVAAPRKPQVPNDVVAWRAAI
jgi:hypothetical protein